MSHDLHEQRKVEIAKLLSGMKGKSNDEIRDELRKLVEQGSAKAAPSRSGVGLWTKIAIVALLFGIYAYDKFDEWQMERAVAAWSKPAGTMQRSACLSDSSALLAPVVNLFADMSEAKRRIAKSGVRGWIEIRSGSGECSLALSVLNFVTQMPPELASRGKIELDVSVALRLQKESRLSALSVSSDPVRQIAVVDATAYDLGPKIEFMRSFVKGIAPDSTVLSWVDARLKDGPPQGSVKSGGRTFNLEFHLDHLTLVVWPVKPALSK